MAGIVLLAGRDEADIVGQWRQLLAHEEKLLRQSLDSRIKLHASAMRWWRSRTASAEGAGAIITAADLKQGEREYERDTLPERRALSHARRMLRSRQP